MPTQNIVVTNLKALKALKNHTNGELAYVEETKEIYTWNEEKNEQTNMPWDHLFGQCFLMPFLVY